MKQIEQAASREGCTEPQHRELALWLAPLLLAPAAMLPAASMAIMAIVSWLLRRTCRLLHACAAGTITSRYGPQEVVGSGTTFRRKFGWQCACCLHRRANPCLHALTDTVIKCRYHWFTTGLATQPLTSCGAVLRCGAWTGWPPAAPSPAQMHPQPARRAACGCCAASPAEPPWPPAVCPAAPPLRLRPSTPANGCALTAVVILRTRHLPQRAHGTQLYVFGYSSPRP